MRAVVLASGSKGNCTFIETSHYKILIDIGKNTKYITEKLQEININPEDINYILISHTHSDHIQGLKSFLKKYKPIVCMSEMMFHELEDLDNYHQIIIYGTDIILDELVINVFKTSHDVDSRGFLFSDKNSSLVYVTDTGYLNMKYFNKLENKNVYIIESNHDVEMLMNGKYPKWLKARVLSDIGHLSNKTTGLILSKLIGPKTKEVVLAHLSAENNTEEKAISTITETLHEYNKNCNKIICAKPSERTEEINV